VSVGAAPLVADLRHFLLLGFFAFGVVFVISFRLLNNVSPCSSGRSSLAAPVVLVLNIVDFLFRWLVAGAPICLYVRTDETFTLRMSRRELTITIVAPSRRMHPREATKSLGVYVGWAENGMGRRYFRFFAILRR
jgi:hypothetical protein